MELYKRIGPIKRETWLLAQSARNQAGWNLPVKTNPPVPRWVTVKFFVREQYRRDADNAWAAAKPLIDALKNVLLVDDSFDWCRLYEVEQFGVASANLERTVIDVWLTPPTFEELQEGRTESAAEAV